METEIDLTFFPWLTEIANDRYSSHSSHAKYQWRQSYTSNACICLLRKTSCDHFQL